MEEKLKNDPLAEKVKNDARQKRNPLIAACGLLVLAVACLCCMLPAGVMGFGLAMGAAAESNRVTDSRTEILELSREGTVNLEVSNNVGTTSIRGANVDEIEVQIDLKATGITLSRAEETLQGFQVDVRRSGNRYIVEVENAAGGGFLSNAEAKIRITVPRELNIDAQTNVGLLSVREVEIVDTLNLQNNVGGIEFEGTIANAGSYNMQSNVGGVEVQVNKNSRFSLNAVTDVGGIDLLLTLQDLQQSRDGASENVSGVYGSDNNPAAQLNLRANVGGIEIRD